MARTVRHSDSLIVLSTIMVVAACSSDSGGDNGADSSRAGVAMSSSVDILARAVCDSSATRWRAISKATVQVRDTIVTPENRNSVQQDLPAEALPSTSACVVSAESIMSAVPDSEVRVWDSWTEIWFLGADGAGSSSQTFQKGRVRCQVLTQSDDAHGDTVAAGDSRYFEAITCWHHNREVIPTDTGRPPAP